MKSNFFNLLSLQALSLLVIPVIAQAVTELESAGAVYPVVELDVRIEMKQQAAERWQLQKEEYQEKIRTYQPAQLQPLPKAEQDRSFIVDMTYTLDHDMTDRDGRVIYAKGYSFNPLDYINLTIGLVVIDGSDPAQVKWFQDSPYASNYKMKLLLSGGYAQSLIPQLKRAVFYLDKEIGDRFQLAAVPCVVVPQDSHIQVTEFLIEEEKR